MRRRSLRRTLLAWNAGVVVGLLGLFGLGVSVVSQVRLRREVDADLERQARRGAEVGPPPEPPRARRPMEEVPDRFRLLYEPARRLADIRQPRFFAHDGAALRPRRGPGNPPFPGGPGGPGLPPGPERFPEPEEMHAPPRVPAPDPTVDAAGLQRGLSGEAGFRTVDWQGERVRVFTFPIRREGRIVGAVQTARELRDLDDLARSQAWTLLLFLPAAAVAAGGAAFALANRALRPIAQVTRTASEIGGADLRRRLDVVGDDEMAELARTFNGMLGRLEGAFTDLGAANSRLAQSLEVQRRFTADASHELRTPLTRLRLAADVGRDSAADEAKLREALDVAQRASGSMTRLVEGLLTLARVDAGQLPVRAERLDLRIVVAEALDGIPGSDRVEAAFPDRPVPVKADPDHLRRIVINLVENALRHSPAPHHVWVRVTDVRGAEVEVVDDGEGIPPEHLPRVFDRFHRVDASRTGGGTGLGLAICRDLARANAAEITLESHPGKGTRARLAFSLDGRG